MKAIQVCNPLCDNFLCPKLLKPLVQMYNLSQEAIEIETTLAKRTLESKSLHNTRDVLLQLLPLNDAFPQLTKLIRIAMTIAVSSAHCERTFSALKRIKTYLRSTMGEQRLSDFAVLSVEREISSSLDLEDVVSEFGGIDRNRRIALT